MDNGYTIALIAAGSALFGGLIPQVFGMIQLSREQKHKRNIHLRQKYEDLANHVTDSMEWVNQLGGALTLEGLSSDSVPIRARRALALASLYFPELRKYCIDYLNALVDYHVVLVDSYKTIPSVNAAGQAVAHNKKEYLAAMSTIQKTRQILDEAVIRHAPIYAKA